MAYKDRMIASRSIAAAVREARIEMKKLGEAKGATATRTGSTLPAPHRRGVPTAARLREAVRRDLKSLEKFAGDVTAKAAGSTEADALMQELADQAGKLMELEAPDKLWNSWDDDERDGWNRLAQAASAVYDEALSGNASAAALSRTLAKLENVLADLQDYVQVDAEEMAGVDLDDMMEIADQYLEEEGKSAGDVSTKDDGGMIFESWWSKLEAALEVEPWDYDFTALRDAADDMDFDTLADEVAYAIDAAESEGMHDRVLGLLENFPKSMLKSAGDSVATKGEDDYEEYLADVEAEDGIDNEMMTEIEDAASRLGGEVRGSGSGSGTSSGRGSVTTTVMVAFEDKESMNRFVDKVEDIDGVTDVVRMGGVPGGIEYLSAGDSVEAKTTKGVTTTADDLLALANRLYDAGFEDLSLELEGAANDLEEGDEEDAAMTVTEVRRALEEADLSGEGDDALYDDVLDAALNLGRKGSPSSTRTKLMGGTVKLELDGVGTDAIEDLVVEYGGEMTVRQEGSVAVATVEFEDAGLMQDFVDAIQSDGGNAVTIVDVSEDEKSASRGVRTKASSLSDVEERLGAAMNAMGKAANVASEYSDDAEGAGSTADADQADRQSVEYQEVAGNIQATDADDAEGIQQLITIVAEYGSDNAIQDPDVADQVGRFLEQAGEALEAALDALSAYEGKSATGSTPSTRTKGDALDAAVAAAIAQLEQDLSPDASPPLNTEDSRIVREALDAGKSGSLDEFIEALLDADYDALAQAIEDADAEDDSEGKSYSAAAREKRREGLDTKRAGEGELEALKADYEAFAREYDDLLAQAADAVDTGDETEDSRIVDWINDLGIEEKFADVTWEDGGYSWSEIADAIKSTLADMDGADAAKEILQQALTALKQFDGDKWYEQWTEESDAEDDSEGKSYSAASREKRREALDTKRAGEGELDALIRDYETFAWEYNDLLAQAANALVDTGDDNEEVLTDIIGDLGIEEEFADVTWEDGGYPWGEIADSISGTIDDMKEDGQDATAEILQQALTALKQFDGDKWYEQWQEESDAE